MKSNHSRNEKWKKHSRNVLVSLFANINITCLEEDFLPQQYLFVWIREWTKVNVQALEQKVHDRKFFFQGLELGWVTNAKQGVKNHLGASRLHWLWF